MIESYNQITTTATKVFSYKMGVSTNATTWIKMLPLRQKAKILVSNDHNHSLKAKINNVN
jgi:hypothetical protein